MKIRNLITLLSALIIFQANADSIPAKATYTEKYRPRYHYTPANRWMGDPSGLIKHKGKYRAYNWGASESEDLVHWKELNTHSMIGVPKGISTFTGSTVVDKENTAGYGKDAMIAVFTMFDNESKKQAQAISFSEDGGETFHYYDRNPVLDIWSTEFRDPTVIYDQQTQRWIMVVAKALEKKVAFYASKNLKDWEWLSDFGPLGDADRSWECPDLFRLPVDDNRDNMKWVLLVSVNWAREQYFIGDFNGKEFIAETPEVYPLYVDQGLDYYASRVFQNYDEPDAPVYTMGWVCTWDYANQQPSEWGKGIWSIPREYSLRSTPSGLRLYQAPLQALEKLRGNPYKMNKAIKAGITPLKEVAKMDNSYEMRVDFEVRDGAPVGLNLCQGKGKKVMISYDPQSKHLTLYRNGVTDADIPKFERIAMTKVMPIENHLLLDVFVDKATIEIFVNDGEAVMTALTYPGEGQNEASIFTLSPQTRVNMTVWPLASIWTDSSSLTSQ